MAEKKVKITVPRARKGEPDSLYIGINGVNYLIPKGKAVEVPDFVAEEYHRAQDAEEFMYDQKEQMLKTKPE